MSEGVRLEGDADDGQLATDTRYQKADPEAAKLHVPPERSDVREH